jgi:hypothetical protein
MGRIFLQVFWIDKDYYKLGVFLFWLRLHTIYRESDANDINVSE